MFNLFGENEVLRKISDLGDPLEKLDTVIDWEIFRPTLTELLSKEPKGKGGRPHWDYVLMFKILILQRLYNLSDDQTEKIFSIGYLFVRFFTSIYLMRKFQMLKPFDSLKINLLTTKQGMLYLGCLSNRWNKLV